MTIKSVNGVAVEDEVTVIRKTADKTLNNVAVLENDDHLLLAIGANEIWQIDIFIMYYGTEVCDITFGFSFPVNCLLHWGAIASGKNGGADNTWGIVPITTYQSLKIQTGFLDAGAQEARTGIKLSIIAVNGANAGNVNLQWCQDTAEVADLTVYENSCIIAHQLA